jgi:hypothetical protein
MNRAGEEVWGRGYGCRWPSSAVGCQRMRPGKPVALVETTELACGHSDGGTVGISVISPGGGYQLVGGGGHERGEGVVQAAHAWPSASQANCLWRPDSRWRCWLELSVRRSGRWRLMMGTDICVDGLWESEGDHGAVELRSLGVMWVRGTSEEGDMYIFFVSFFSFDFCPHCAYA